MIDYLHPGLLLIIAALPIPWLHDRLRELWVVLFPIVALYLVWQWPQGHYLQFKYLDYELSLIVVDHLSRVFALVFALFTALAMLFVCRHADWRESRAGLFCAGSALGVVFAGDLITLFIFWVMLALGGALLIRAHDTNTARITGQRYLYLHLCGCALLLTGIIGHVDFNGSVDFAAMTPDTVTHGFMLAGFLLGVAAVPVSFWLPAASAQASSRGAILMSGLLVQTALYVLLRGFPGAELLIAIGLLMIAYGIVYAVLSDTVSRLLAYSLVSQAGFVLVAIGIGSEPALNAAVAMTVMTTLIMGLLFMTAASVTQGTGRQRLSELGGLYQSMPLTTACTIVAALSLLAVPLTGGHVSRVLLDEAVRVDTFSLLGWLLYAGLAGVVLQAGLRYPWFAFYDRDSGLRVGDPPWNMRLSMLLLAWVCILVGMAPCQLYALLPYTLECEPYAATNVLIALQRTGFSALGFFLLLPWLLPRRRPLPDVDWLLARLWPRMQAMFSHAARFLGTCMANQAIREASLITGLILILLLTLYWI